MTDLPFIPAELDDAGLSPRAFRLYCHLCRRGPGAWGSVDNMAETCGINRKTVILALSELLASGLIRRESRHGKTSVYSPCPCPETRPAKRVDPENGPAPETGRRSARKTDCHPAQKTGYKGSPEKVPQRRNPPPPPGPPPTEAGEGGEKEAQRIVSLYPANGSRREALAHCLNSLRNGSGSAMAAAVAAHARCWQALSPDRQRYCPSLPAYFRDERWRDAPGLHPWTLFPQQPETARRPSSFPAAQPLKVRSL